LEPVIVIALTCNAPFPVLVRLTLITLEPAFFTAPKFNAVGASCTVPLARLIAAVAVFVASVTEVAVRVTLGSVGTVGAAE
jgi:hypothetical protein